MPESIKMLLHQMMQNHQILIGSLELGRWPAAMIAARDLGDQTDALIVALAAMERVRLTA